MLILFLILFIFSSSSGSESPTVTIIIFLFRILFNLFRDYLATPEQKTKIIRMQNEARQKSELKKQQMYNTDVFANKRSIQREELEKNKVLEENKTEANNEGKQIVIYKENIFRRIFNKIKSLFIKK